MSSRLDTSHTEDEDIVVVDRDDISNYNAEQILPESPQEIGKIRSWLQATEYAHQSGEFRKHLASHMQGTGIWLTKSAAYISWLNDENHGLLWIKGIPGSGKSVVAAHLIRHLKEFHTPVLYFFFRQIIDANHEPAALLRDWLDQVLDYSPPLQSELKEFLKKKRSLSSVSMDDLWGFLRLALKSLPSNSFCVADALDEMDSGNEGFLRSLAEFGQWMPSKVKLLITSRPVPAIEATLRRFNLLQLSLEEKLVDTDISRYVEWSLQSCDLSTATRDTIRSAVPGQANGIFLYAKLAMNSFLEPGADVNAVLRALPTNLHEMYTKLLREHAARSGVSHDIQLLLLQWVTHAIRPLRLLELAEMMHVTYRHTSPQSAPSNIETAKSLVRTAVGPLLEILPNETICVIHHSFTEYLKCMTRSESDHGYPILRPGDTHGRLATACIQYLQAGCLESIIVKTDRTQPSVRARINKRGSGSEDEEQRIRLQYPFYAYAADCWHLHVTRSCAAYLDQGSINSALETLFANEQRAGAWLKFHWAESDEAKQGVTPLHIAARFGLTKFASHLKAAGADIQAVDVHGKTPIWWAADGGHADMINLLVQAGAEPDVDEKQSGLRPLHQAARKNYGEAVRVLLGAGVDPLTKKTRNNPGMWCGNSPSSRGHTPLMYACHNGHLEALEAFLPFLTDINTVHCALAWSADYGRSKLVRRLLQHPGIDPNAKIRGNTIIFSACRSLDSESVMALIEAGADPSILSVATDDEFAGMRTVRMKSLRTHIDTRRRRGFTALHALCNVKQWRYPKTGRMDPTVQQRLFELLLEKGVSVDIKRDDGCTALHTAVQSPILTRLLLRAGADANALNDKGYTPLHRATSPATIALLVEEGQANLNTIIPSDGRTPLLSMLHGHHTGAVSKLLEYHPDLTAKDSEGNGPLHIALTACSTDITVFEALLDAGADPDERNCAGETPLLALKMDKRNSNDIVDMLIQRGANINSKDLSGMTLLSRSIRRYSPAVKSDHPDIKALLDRGADPNVRDYAGKSLLHHAVATHDCLRFAFGLKNQSSTSKLDYLLDLSLDRRVQDYRGNSLIHELASREGMLDSYQGPRYIPLWEKLLDLGLDINQENHQGRSAVHILSASKSSCRHNSPPFTYKIGHVSPLDFVISSSRDIDQPDYQGLTALHLASTVSEYITKKLLDGGADPTRTTLEGLTTLHLSARARQSNIVGMLLESSKIKNSTVINAQDRKGNTPMYYACRSGVLETVELLLEAGADASSKALWIACSEFEDEEQLWIQDRRAEDLMSNGEAGGLTIEDKTRPGPLPNKYEQQTAEFDSQKHKTRLEEIVEILSVQGCDTSGLLQAMKGALSKAEQSYTFSCLLQARDRTLPTGKSTSTGVALFLESSIGIQKEAQKKVATKSSLVEQDQASGWLVKHMLEKRQYHVIRSLFEHGVHFLKETEPTLELFVQHGYASLLEEIGTLEVERRHKEGVWHAFNDKSRPGLHTELELEARVHDGSSRKGINFLLTALRRNIPNMSVVRLLVENFHVDINAYHYEKRYLDNSRYELLRKGTALHEVAQGKYWWHVALAIPYLLAMGAKIDAKNHAGLTPLHIALGGPDNYVGPFHKEAVRALLTGGADVNEKDKKGMSCLAYTAGDPEMVKLLLDHHVEITSDALFMAIYAKRPDILDALLKADTNPNMRPDALQPQCSIEATSKSLATYELDKDVPLEELYPLYYAATHHGSQDRMIATEERHSQWLRTVELMQKLLSSGADPHASFFRWSPQVPERDPDKEGEDKSVQELLRDGQASNHGLEEVLLAHEVLAQRGMIHPILSFEKLDANRRDAKGRTLLHIACQSYNLNAKIDSVLEDTDIPPDPLLPSFLDCLLSRGADPLATDSTGNNLLHHMFLSKKQRRTGDQDASTITHLTNLYPALTNQANISGKRPLHMALKHAALHNDLRPTTALLEAGADPFATDKNGNGCLHLLAFALYRSADARSCFASLVGRGLNINAKNKLGETPIFNLNKHLIASTTKTAQQTSAADVLSIFEEAGADLFSRDSTGRGLLHIAARETEEPVKNQRLSSRLGDLESAEPSLARFQVLLARGLDPMVEDSQKRTALDVAAACGKESVLALFEKGASLQNSHLTLKGDAT